MTRAVISKIRDWQELSKAKELHDAAGIVRLEGLNLPKFDATNLPSKSELRALRKVLLQKALDQEKNREGRLSERLKARLEREPIVRTRTKSGQVFPWSRGEISLAGLYDAAFRSQSARPFLKPGRVLESKPEPGTHFGLLPRMALRVALQGQGLDNALTAAILKELKHSQEFRSKFGIVLQGHPNPGVFTHARTLTEDYLMVVLCRNMPDTSAAFAITKEITDRAVRLSKEWNGKPDFIKRTPQAAKIFLWGDVPEKFFSPLLECRSGITNFIEEQPNMLSLVPRNPRKQGSQFQTLSQFEVLPYDFSKVKRFDLSDNEGNKLKVVSKRLAPINHSNAESEFVVSGILHGNGIATPEPLAMIQAQGNTYFLWEGKDFVSEVAGSARGELRRQQAEILCGLHHLKIPAPHSIVNNFRVTQEESGYKVWLVDLDQLPLP